MCDVGRGGHAEVGGQLCSLFLLPSLLRETNWPHPFPFFERKVRSIAVLQAFSVLKKRFSVGELLFHTVWLFSSFKSVLFLMRSVLQLPVVFPPPWPDLPSLPSFSQKLNCGINAGDCIGWTYIVSSNKLQVSLQFIIKFENTLNCGQAGH